MAIGFVAVKPFQHASFETRLLDTGIYHNLVWRLANGLGSWSDVLGRDHFGEHFNPIVLLLAVVYQWVASPNVLLVAQGLAMGLTVWLLAAWALPGWPVLGWPKPQQTVATDNDASVAASKDPKHRPSQTLKSFAWIGGLAWALATLTHRGLMAAWSSDFQPIVLGMPMLIGGLLALRSGRTGWVWVCALLLLTTRESAPLSVLGLAMVAGLAFGRWKLAAALAVVAGVAFALAFGWVMPHFRGPSEWHQAGRLGLFNDWGTKARYLLLLLLPLAGLPLIGWRVAIGAVPGLLLNLATDTGNQYALAYHYDAQLAVFLVAGAWTGWCKVFAFQAGIETAATQPTSRLAAIARRVPKWPMLFLGVWGLWITTCMGPTLWSKAQAWWPDAQDQALAQAIENAQLGLSDATIRWAADDVVGPHVCASEGFVSIKVDRRVVTDGSHPYIQDLKPGQCILLARRSFDYQENRAAILATGRAKVLVDGPQLTVLQWLDQQGRTENHQPAAASDASPEPLVGSSSDSEMDSPIDSPMPEGPPET